MINKQNKIIVGIIALILALTVGYAIFFQSLNINGTATAKGEFGLIFENSSKTPTCRGYSGGDDCTIEQVSSISEDGRTITVTVDKLLYPTAYVKIPALIKNTGTVDAILEGMEITGLDSNDIDVKYSITEEDIKNGYIVKPGNDNRKEVEIEVSWNKDSTYSSDAPLSITFNITMNYKQATNASINTTSSSQSSFPVLMGSLGDNVTFVYNNGNISINGTGSMWSNTLTSDDPCYLSGSQYCPLYYELALAHKKTLDINISNNFFDILVGEFLVGGTYENIGLPKDQMKSFLMSSDGGNSSEDEANKIIEILDSIPKLKNVTIENGITSIRPYLFQSINASDLTITLPNTIASKSINVFDASRVGTVTFEKGTKTIYEETCYASDGMIDNVIIPDGVETIETNSIYTDDGTMTTLIIPSSVTTIENSSINGQNLTKIVNKTGKKFDWNGILTGTSGEAFETGTVEYNGKTITITNE